MKLVIGTQTYSSWSMRPWIAMVHFGFKFDEIVIPLYQNDTKERIKHVAPAGKVPVLIDHDIKVWESLAILEYLNEKFPEAGMWPAAPKARAHARSIASEMHAGFAAMRKHLPMNFDRVQRPRPDMPDDVKADIARIHTAWTKARELYSSEGPFLYGKFSCADAMFAPVVSRFHSYAIEAPNQIVADYMAAMMELPAWQRWVREVNAEPKNWKNPTYDEA